jgi:hypothetical protein
MIWRIENSLKKIYMIRPQKARNQMETYIILSLKRISTTIFCSQNLLKVLFGV